MKRLHTLALAGVAAVWISGTGFAQTTPPPAVQSSPSPFEGATPPARDPTKADKRQMSKEEKKVERLAARRTCRAQGKQRSLSGLELRGFVKNCVTAPQ